MTAQIIMLADARRMPHVTTAPQPAPANRRRGRSPDSRQARFERWCDALSLANFYKALRRLRTEAEICRKRGHNNDFSRGDYATEYFAILDDERKAVARCILTPAPTRREIEWKRVALRRKGLTGYITEAKALAAIEADERWHAANPYRRAAGRTANGGGE